MRKHRWAAALACALALLSARTAHADEAEETNEKEPWGFGLEIGGVASTTILWRLPTTTVAGRRLSGAGRGAVLWDFLSARVTFGSPNGPYFNLLGGQVSLVLPRRELIWLEGGLYDQDAAGGGYIVDLPGPGLRRTGESWSASALLVPYVAGLTYSGTFTRYSDSVSTKEGAGATGFGVRADVQACYGDQKKKAAARHFACLYAAPLFAMHANDSTAWAPGMSVGIRSAWF